VLNVGAPELLVVMIVALLVLGPEKLPEVARKVGNVVGELRRMSAGFQAEVRDAFQREIGLKPVAKGLDYNIDYLQKFITKQGKFEGTLYRLGATSSPDPVDYYVWRYWSKAGPTSGALFSGEGSDIPGGDKKVDDFIEKAKAETDVKKQTALLHDLQRHLAKYQYCISRAGLASGFTLAWPAAGNFQVFQGDSRAINQHFYTTWVDETKAPIKKT